MGRWFTGDFGLQGTDGGSTDTASRCRGGDDTACVEPRVSDDGEWDVGLEGRSYERTGAEGTGIAWIVGCLGGVVRHARPKDSGAAHHERGVRPGPVEDKARSLGGPRDGEGLEAVGGEVVVGWGAVAEVEGLGVGDGDEGGDGGEGVAGTEGAADGFGAA